MYAPLLDGIVRAFHAQGVEAERTTIRARGWTEGHGIASLHGRGGVLVHGTLLIGADLKLLRACLAGPRGGDLGGAPRPAPSRPDHVTNVGGDGWEAALIDAFGARPEPLDAERAERAATLAAQKYHDPAWHAGSWMERFARGTGAAAVR